MYHVCTARLDHSRERNGNCEVYSHAFTNKYLDVWEVCASWYSTGLERFRMRRRFRETKMKTYTGVSFCFLVDFMRLNCDFLSHEIYKPLIINHVWFASANIQSTSGAYIQPVAHNMLQNSRKEHHGQLLLLHVRLSHVPRRCSFPTLEYSARW